MNVGAPPPAPPVTPDERTTKVIAFYETLTPATLGDLETIYPTDARFTDPFNDVTGQAAIRRIFEHMFATLDTPRFAIAEAVTQREQCFLLWNFHYRRKGSATAAAIHGASHLRFAADGRIAAHRDYWDPARELYEGVPVLGAVMRWLRRRLSAGSAG